MEKVFSKIEINTIKAIAKQVAPYAAKKQKLDAQIAEVEEKVAEAIRKRAQEKIDKLEAEKKSYQGIIDSMNETVKRMTGGYTTEDLVNCVKEGTGKMDEKTGKEIMQTRFILKYPETVIPTEVPPTTEAAGSDFDKDAEAECPTHEAAQEEVAEEEMPEELVAEQAEAAIAYTENAGPFADADPFGN